MLSLVQSYITFLLFATLATPTAHALTVRDTESDISTTKGGILVKNGKQTSCELGVIDSTAAFVAAPCLDLIGNSFNATTVYEVYLDAGINNTPAKYSVNSIALHPLYNATTNLNPIGIIQFNNGSTETWSNPIAIDRNNSWDDVLFISRGMTDMNSLQWRTPLTTTNNYSTGSACKLDTGVFDENQDDLFCSNATTYPPFTYLTTCAIPYSSVNAYISGKLYIAGIYAYTVMLSSNYACTLQSGRQNSMFVLFADYIAFASALLGRSIGYYPNSNGIAPQSSSAYSMKTPSSITPYLIENGDFYANQTTSLATNSGTNSEDSAIQPQSSSGSSINKQGSFNASDQSENDDSASVPASRTPSGSPNDKSNGIDENRSNSSKKMIVIGAICGIFGGLVLACLLWHLYKRWRRAHRNIYRDKNAQLDMRAMFVVDSPYISAPPSIFVPSVQSSCHILHVSSPLKSIATIHTPTSILSRSPFDDLEYHLSPLYGSHSPPLPSSSLSTRFSVIKHLGHF